MDNIDAKEQMFEDISRIEEVAWDAMASRSGTSEEKTI